VGHGTDGAAGVFDHQHAAGFQSVEEGGPVSAYSEDHEVRGAASGIQPAEHRLGQPSGGFDPVERGQSLGQAAGVGMVLGQPIDHPVRPVAQRDQPGRGQDADLAHSASDELPAAMSPEDELL
jgi:hypothetical protein